MLDRQIQQAICKNARDYLIDYRVTKVERTFNAPSTSIWEEREYVWKVSVQVRVNTNG